MAAIAFSSVPGTLIGSVPVSFSGALQYTGLTTTQGILTIQVQNTTDPSLRGYMLAFAFGNPAARITAVAPTYINTGMGQIGSPSYSASFDCNNAVTSYGTYDIGFSANGTDWNNTGYILTPRAGIRPGQTGVFQMTLTGTNMLALNEGNFQASLSSGGRFFTTNFGLMNDEQGTTGRNYIAAG